MTPKKRITLREIAVEVAAKYRITLDDLVGHDRSVCYVHPRQEVYYRAYIECPHLSYPEIGRRMGGRDHTTVRHGVIVHCNRIGIAYADALNLRRVGPSFTEVMGGYALAMEKAYASRSANV